MKITATKTKQNRQPYCTCLQQTSRKRQTQSQQNKTASECLDMLNDSRPIAHLFHIHGILRIYFIIPTSRFNSTPSPAHQIAQLSAPAQFQHCVTGFHKFICAAPRRFSVFLRFCPVTACQHFYILLYIIICYIPYLHMYVHIL